MPMLQLMRNGAFAAGLGLALYAASVLILSTHLC